MDNVYVVIEFVPGSFDILGVWNAKEEAEKAIIREAKRELWFAGEELDDIEMESDSYLQQQTSEKFILEVPMNTDSNRLGTNLVIDGYTPADF